MTSSKFILYLVLALALARGILYASIVPPWQAPDEPAQFERAKAALDYTEWNGAAGTEPVWYGELSQSLFTFGLFDFVGGSRPTYSPQTPLNRYIALYHEIYGGLYGSRPAYFLIGWPLWLARNQDIILQLYLVRLNTVLMNVGIILLAYLITSAIFPHDLFLKLGVPLLILFSPQHTHLLSTVNNGNLAELLATAALYVIVISIIKGFSWLKILLITGLTLAAMWTKATAYFLLFAIGTIGLFHLWRYRRYWYGLLPVMIILGGLIYFFAPKRLSQLIADAWSWLQTGRFELDPVVPKEMFRSFWAMPGWAIFQVPLVWYYLLAFGCILAIVGLIVLTITHWQLIREKSSYPQIQALIVLMVTIGASIGVLLAWNGITHTITYRQGRSIYPAIVPIYIFLMLGWRQFIPLAWRQAGLLVITTAFFLFDTMVLFDYIIPFFYSRY